MGHGCCSGTSCGTARGFLTKEEKIEMLKEYEEQLQKELTGVRERIADIKNAA